MTIGNAYTAIRAWLDVRSRGGEFVLRIDDTDPSRTSVTNADIESALAMMGLDWAEGPDRGGPYEPYVTSERRARHQEVAESLVAAGHAYWDYTPPIDDIDSHKLTREGSAKGPTEGYRGTATPVDGVDPVLRLRVCSDEVTVKDRVFGEISVAGDDIDEVALMRADGRPTYHLASNVDDVDMGITSIVRGADWLNFLPQHILVFRALGADLPEFAHIPLLQSQDGQKLSKRQGDLSIAHLIGDEGIPPEPFAAYIANLGFAERSDLLTLGELADGFDIAAMRRSSPRFDPKKLRSFARRWMAEREPPERLASQILMRSDAAGLTRRDAQILVPGVRGRSTTYSDAAGLAEFVGFDDKPGRDRDHLDDADVDRILAVRPWTADALDAEVAATFGVYDADGRKRRLTAMRDSLAPGLRATPPLHFMLATLGPDRSAARLRSGR